MYELKPCIDYVFVSETNYVVSSSLAHRMYELKPCIDYIFVSETKHFVSSSSPHIRT